MELPSDMIDLAKELHQLLTAVSPKSHQHPGRVKVWEKNIPIDRILLVRSGVVARFRTGPQGRCIVALRYAGEAFYPHEVTMDSSLATLTPSETLEADGAVLSEALRRREGLADLYQRSIQRNERIAYEWLFRNQMKARARVAHFLCEHADRSGAAAEKQFDLPIFQRNIGDILGIHLMQVNRSLKELERDGLLTNVGVRAFRVDWAALRSVGDYTAKYLA